MCRACPALEKLPDSTTWVNTRTRSNIQLTFAFYAKLLQIIVAFYLSVEFCTMSLLNQQGSSTSGLSAKIFDRLHI